MISGSDISTLSPSSTALQGAHDLDAVARLQRVSAARPRAARRAVERDRDPALRRCRPPSPSSNAASVATTSGSSCAVHPNAGRDGSFGHRVLLQLVLLGAPPRDGRNRSMPNGRIAGSTHAVEHQARDRVGGDRRRAECRCDDGRWRRPGPRAAPGPRIGASSRLPGRCPTHISSIGSSSTAGTARHAASSSVSRPPAVSVRVEAFLLDGRADEQAAVVARHQIDARRPDHVA